MHNDRKSFFFFLPQNKIFGSFSASLMDIKGDGRNTSHQEPSGKEQQIEMNSCN